MPHMDGRGGRKGSKRAGAKIASVSGDRFAPDQLEKLEQALDSASVHTRDVDGRKLSYIEGWFAIAQANEIFGPAAWDREMVYFERVYERSGAGVFSCGYLARVRVRVRAGTTEIIREGTGWGAVSARTISDAHERAIKSAETDATKRALATFGNQFGLSLYDRTAGLSQSTHALISTDGTILASSLSPEGFCTGLRQLVEVCKTEGELCSLAEKNSAGICAVKARAPLLKNKLGEHYADILLRLIDDARAKLRASESLADHSEVAAVSVSEQSVETPDFQNRSICAGEQGACVSIQGRESNGAGVGGAKIPLERISRSCRVPRVCESDSGGLVDRETTDDQGVTDSRETLAPSRITAGRRVDKSRLAFGVVEKRLRDKQHLKRVAKLPCLICSRQPSHPHHLRFAQKRGMGQKVSDEFVVPLCALHHGQLHCSQSEINWWRAQKIDPLPISSELWSKRSAYA